MTTDYIRICSILTNDSDTERQIIGWSALDGCLYSDHQEEPLLDGETWTIAQAVEVCKTMYFDGWGWKPEWCDNCGSDNI